MAEELIELNIWNLLCNHPNYDPAKDKKWTSTEDNNEYPSQGEEDYIDYLQRQYKQNTFTNKEVIVGSVGDEQKEQIIISLLQCNSDLEFLKTVFIIMTSVKYFYMIKNIEILKRLNHCLDLYGRVKPIIRYGMQYFSWLMLRHQTQKNKQFNKNSISVWTLKEATHLPLFQNLDFEDNPYIPIISRDIHKMVLGYNQKNRRLNTLREFHNEFKNLTPIDVNDPKAFITGSRVIAAISDSDKSQYANSDLDVGVYGKTKDLERVKDNIGKGCDKKVVRLKRTKSHRYHLHIQLQLNKELKIDLFPVWCNPASFVKRFHLSCTKSFYTEGEVYLLWDCVCAHLSGISCLTNFYIGKSIESQIETCSKYQKRGFATALNKERLVPLLEDDVYFTIKPTHSKKKWLMYKVVNEEIYIQPPKIKEALMEMEIELALS